MENGGGNGPPMRGGFRGRGGNFCNISISQMIRLRLAQIRVGTIICRCHNLSHCISIIWDLAQRGGIATM